MYNNTELVESARSLYIVSVNSFLIITDAVQLHSWQTWSSWVTRELKFKVVVLLHRTGSMLPRAVREQGDVTYAGRFVRNIQTGSETIFLKFFYVLIRSLSHMRYMNWFYQTSLGGPLKMGCGANLHNGSIYYHQISWEQLLMVPLTIGLSLSLKVEARKCLAP